jgi:hypothetical protein
LIALVLGNIDLDVVVAAVEGVVGGIVGDGILIAKFFADVLEGLVEVVDVVRIERSTTGFVG